MKAILTECEPFLISKAEESNNDMFPNAAAAASWAALAEQCNLSTLLAHAELYMVKHASSDFWQPSVPAFHQLSRNCLMRILRAAQWHTEGCHSKINELARGRSGYTVKIPNHVDVPILVGWQTNSSCKAVLA